MRSIVAECKKSLPQRPPSPHPPDDLEFRIYKMFKEGKKRADIARELKADLNKRNLDESRGHRDFADRAIKNVAAWINTQSKNPAL
jgi:hypothetical protein